MRRPRRFRLRLAREGKHAEKSRLGRGRNAWNLSAAGVFVNFRLLLFGLVVLPAALAACGGGGGSPPGGGGSFTPPPPPPSSPTASPTPAFLAQIPIVPGDKFAYAGTLSATQVYTQPQPSPLPSTSTSAQVTQTVSVAAAAGGASQFQISEADAYPTKTTDLTNTETEAFSAVTASTANLVEENWSSKDSLGNSVAFAYAAPQIVAQLPFSSANAWTNLPAVTITESDADGTQSTRTYANDGSYTDDQTLIYGPSGTGTATIVENADGSGKYASNVFASAEDEFDFSAPSGGRITISGLFPYPPPPTPNPSGAPSPTPNPSPTPKVISLTAWYAAATPLYKETDSDTGSVAIPGACNVPSGVATKAEAIAQTIDRLDTVIGYAETQTATAYFAPNAGQVCTQLQDVTKSYYDYQGDVAPGQTGVTIGLYAFYPTPFLTTTITETIGMQSETTLSQHRTTQSAKRSFASSLGVFFEQRASFMRLIERERTRRVKAMQRALLRMAHAGGAA